MQSLILNHPVIDGNERVGVAAAELFIHANGWEIIARGSKLEDFTSSASQRRDGDRATHHLVSPADGPARMAGSKLPQPQGRVAEQVVDAQKLGEDTGSEVSLSSFEDGVTESLVSLWERQRWARLRWRSGVGIRLL
jgi:hypothetical protein